MRNKNIKDYIYRNTYQNTSIGYVLTISELASEMIDMSFNEKFEHLFKSDSTTFLCPICKGGTYLIEIVERLLKYNHSIENIEKRIYTVDYNNHSLNLAQGAICKILTLQNVSIKEEIMNNIVKHSFIESYYNDSIKRISNNKYKTIEDFFNKLILDKKDYYLLNMLNDAAKEFIEKYEKISKKESNLFGEVFTTKKLINEILDTLPTSVWKNKNLKWLDSSSGINNFFIEVTERLMIGLSDEIKNDYDRYKWIVEDMLHSCEIQTKNIFILQQLFDRNNEFNLKVYKGDFLSDGFKKKMEEWNIIEFDVSLGNPPYNDISESEKKGSKQTLKKKWMQFIDRSMEISKHTLFVTPNNWLKKSCYLNEIFKKHLISAEVDSDYIKKEYFPTVGSTFSYYLLSKEEISDKSKIFINKTFIDVDFSKMNIFPSVNVSKESFSIFNKVSEKCKTKIQFTRTQYDKISNIDKVIYIDRSKTIGFIKPINLDEVKNVPGETYWCESDISDILLNNLNTKIYRFMLKNVRSGMAIVSTINSLSVYYEKIMTDKDFYEYFDLSLDEIKLIEDSVKYKK